MTSTTESQERYQAHQKRKAESLAGKRKKHKDHKKNPKFWDVLERRSSTRVFGDGEVDLTNVIKALELVPSSCDRRAISYEIVSARDAKTLLGGLLVGGAGWIHRADRIMLLYANSEAYRAIGEIAYMPYLDAGVIIQQTYLAAEAENIACCYVNPNVREEHKEVFNKFFNKKGLLYVGAVAFGKY